MKEDVFNILAETWMYGKEDGAGGGGGGGDQSEVLPLEWRRSSSPSASISRHTSQEEEEGEKWAPIYIPHRRTYVRIAPHSRETPRLPLDPQNSTCFDKCFLSLSLRPFPLDFSGSIAPKSGLIE